MPKNNNKKIISVTSFEKVMKETKQEPMSFEWNGLDVIVRPVLPLTAYLSFVDNVVQVCYDEESSEYLPEAKDFAIRCCVLEIYANFSLPSNTERKYDLVYNTNAFDAVVSHIDAVQFGQILHAIDKKIDILTQSNLAQVTKKVNEMIATIEQMQEKFTDAFQNIAPEALDGFVSAVAGGEFSSDKLVKAYIEHQKHGDA